MFTSHSDTPRIIPLGVKIKLFFGDVLFVIGLAFGLFGLVFVAIFATTLDFASISFSPDGKTTGKISRIEASNASENKQPIYKYYFTYSENGETFKEDVSYELSNNLTIGDNVSVEYQAGKRARIVGMRMAPFQFWLIFLVGIFPTIGIIMLIFAIRKGLKNLDLITNGILTKGKVVGKEVTNTKINNQYVYKIHFEFKDLGGNVSRAVCNTHKVYLVEDEPEEMLVYKTENPSEAVLLDTLHRSVRRFFEQ